MAIARRISFSGRSVREPGIVLMLAALLILVMTIVKVRYVQALQGDSAMFFQMMRNLLHTGIPTSQMGADIQAYLTGLHVQKMPASTMAHAPLAPPSVDSVNMLSWHAYYVYYLLAPFCAIFPVRMVLIASFVASFTGLLVGVYYLARTKGVSVVLALSLVLLVLCHPAWWASLLWGQFYPDRIFVFAEFALMGAISLPKAPRWLILTCAILAASITERGPIIAGISMALYVLLWKRSVADRRFKLGVAVALIAYGAILLAFVIHNPYNTHYFPSSPHEFIVMFSRPYAFAKLALMFAFCAPLLALAGFEWRALVIALVAMAPNVFGSDGGSEKVGWITHYASYYMPILAWAAAMGLSSCVKRCSTVQRRYVFAGMLLALLTLTFLDPFSFAPIRFIQPGPTSAVLPAAVKTIAYSFGPSSAAALADGRRLAQAIPAESRISSIEAGMPHVYRDGVVHLFPLGIDTSDYAILTESMDAEERPVYSGSPSHLGANEDVAINRVLLARMRRAGYDMEHPTDFPSLGLALFKRIRASRSTAERMSSSRP